jgi:aspartyl protease family protein
MDFGDLATTNWQNFIYLLLILSMLLAGLFSRRDFSFKKNLKYLAIWSAIALGVITIFSYRYEFLEFKNRILGEINPAKAQKISSQQLVIRASKDGHFYINAKVNKVAVRFMIDTGASDIVISPKEAMRLGINLKNLSFNKLYQTANGNSWGANTLFEEVQIGDTKFYNIAASVNQSELETSLLGMSFLRRFTKYEFYRDQLILTI